VTDLQTPDIQLAHRFLGARGPRDELLHVAITGSHIYGFSSRDSDIDMKGIHIVPTAQLLGLSPSTPPFDRLEVFEGMECDLTTHEVAHAIGMLLKGNGNVLERIGSPYQLRTNAAFEALLPLAQASVHQGFYKHYAGYFRGMQREHRLRRRAKTALYAFRVALTGHHLLRTGRLVTDVRILGDEHELPVVRELVQFKAAHNEKASIPSSLYRAAEDCWPQLEALLQSALDGSHLPSEPPNRSEFERWLLDVRRAHWDASA